MKHTLFFSVVFFCAGSAIGGPCMPGTLQDYISLASAGCQAGIATFADFKAEPGQAVATPIDPATVLVTPGGAMSRPSLQFTLSQTAATGEVLESFFRFDATIPVLPIVNKVMLDGSATGDGAATATEDICPGATFSGDAPLGCPTAPGSLVTLAVSPFGSIATDKASFPATSFFDVFVDLTVDGGLSGGATLNSATVQFIATPEPAPAALMLTGLVGLAFRRIRRRI
jgi:hypothetical protein